jgi:hypothetical protein
MKRMACSSLNDAGNRKLGKYIETSRDVYTARRIMAKRGSSDLEKWAAAADWANERFSPRVEGLLASSCDAPQNRGGSRAIASG